MGIDVHFAFQKKVNDRWLNITCDSEEEMKLYDECVFDGRHYEFFEWLRDISEPIEFTECDENILNTNLYLNKYGYCDWWAGEDDNYLYGFGCSTLKNFEREINDFKNSYKEGVWVSENFFTLFEAYGGKFPDELIDNHKEFKVIDEDTAWLINTLDNVLYGFKKFAKYYKLNKEKIKMFWCFDC